MTSITRFGFVRHLRAEPNQFVLHYRSGAIVRRGPGLAYWFLPLSSAIAQLPVEDVETTFVLTERTADYQDVSVPLVDAVGRGAEVIRASMEDALRADPEIAAMGLALVSVQVQRVAPIPDVEKALQTPVREAIQQRADEAVFARRAQAVENERAIKQNELSTEIELARRQKDLIRREGANQLLDAHQQAEAERVRAEAELERQELTAQAYARDQRVRAAGDADARRLIGEADADAEARRVSVWQAAPARVILGLAAQEFATKIGSINHLNLTPDLLGATLQQFLHDQTDQQVA
jgi:regulator of protease activity HflC (stomatin/prohibitin superfamily)